MRRALCSFPSLVPDRVRQIVLRPGALMLAVALSACGGGGGSDTVVTQSDGSVQVLAGQVEKGPLLRGSMVTIDTLTTAAVSLAAGTTTLLPGTATTTVPPLVPTGAAFTMEVRDDYGAFAPQSAAIFQSAFVETTAQGYWFNELTGKRADDFITLRAVSNLKSDKALNVNVLTDLTRERTLVLARAAATGTPASVSAAQFDTARRQAQGEALAAFGIKAADLGSVAAFSEMDLKKLVTETTPRPADQILLALSALAVQIGQDGVGVTDFLSRFEADLADNGLIDDTTLKAAILSASAKVNFDQVAANMNGYYKTTRYVGSDIAQWVDRSGGVFGLLQKDVQFLPNLQYASGTPYTSRGVVTPASSIASCYGAEMNDARNGSVQLLEGSTTLSALTAPRLLPASGSTTLALRLTPSNPGAVAYLMRWDAVAGACSATSQPNKSRVFALAAVSPDVALYLSQLASGFNACFALPVASRVLAVDNSLPTSVGGPAVTQVAPACEALVSSATRDGLAFLHNGYNAGQFFYAMLNDGALTKNVAVKDVRIVRGTSAASAPLPPNPTLVFNVLYTDRYNRLGNFYAVAQKLPAGPTASAGWVMTGNQQPVDINVVPQLRRFTSMANYTTATPSIKEQYRSAVGFFVNAFGPGSRLTDGSALSAVRISGAGISGLVYVPPVAVGQTWMDISNAKADVAGAASQRCSATVPATGPAFSNCPYYWVARSTTVVAGGTAAPVLRLPTLTEGSCAGLTAANQACAWGGTWSPTDITASLSLNAAFTVELFYGGRSTPSSSFTKYLNSALPALPGVDTRSWVALDAATLAAARPAAGQTSLDLAWTGQVMNSLEVKSATVTLANAGATVSTPDDPVARGMSQVTLWPAGEIQSVPASASPGATAQRSILLNLRTWDGSSRSQWISYDKVN